MHTNTADASRPRAGDTKKVHITETALTRNNWHKHVNWLNVFFVIGIHLYACVQAFWVPLQTKTAVWAVIYYFITGMGITAGAFSSTLHRHQNFVNEMLTFGWQDTIVYGLTAPIPLAFLCGSGSPPWVVVLFKVLSAGGLVTTAPTIVTPILRKTPTPSGRDCSTRTSVGW